MNMRIGSLFSGIGGLELGLEWSGLGKTLWQVEKDDYATKVLEKHWPEAKRFRDIREVGKANLDPVDLICGGFPCQPFSVVGKRRGAEDDRHLWPEMLRVIRELNPAWVIGENVPGIVNMELDQILNDLESANYTCGTLNIPAASMDAWHIRKRIWILAHINGERLSEFKRQEQKQEVGFRPDRMVMQKIPQEIDTSKAFICRGDDGIPNRVDRVKCLGNAVVPQVSMAIGLIIKEWIEPQ